MKETRCLPPPEPKAPQPRASRAPCGPAPSFRPRISPGAPVPSLGKTWDIPDLTALSYILFNGSGLCGVSQKTPLYFSLKVIFEEAQFQTLQV